MNHAEDVYKRQYLTERKISETQIKEGDPDTCEKLMYALLRSGVAGQAEGE